MCAEFGIYIHVPFCFSRCAYCDFYSNAVSYPLPEHSAEAWLASVVAQYNELAERFTPRRITSIYIGGGSPSCLPRSVISRAASFFFDAARAVNKASGFLPPLEFSVELNPEDIDADYIQALADSGVSRISFGLQSLEDATRAAVGRRGDSRAIKKKLERFARCGLSLSADIMYGLPFQTPVGVRRDIGFVSGLGFQHVSLYELTLEPAAPLARALDAGAVQLPPDDLTDDLYDSAGSALRETGFERYEVSNWARNAMRCSHNILYWDMGNWFGLGPSAVGNICMGASFLRLENMCDAEAYCKERLMREYTVCGNDAMFEYCMTTLRTARGFDFANFTRRFGRRACEVFGPLHEEYPELILCDGSGWKATDSGLDMLNIPLVSALQHMEKTKE